VSRDFKTANVFRAEGGLLKVGDFGVSTVLSSTLALAKTAIGTPYYISPEICLNRPYNAKVRVFLLRLTQCVSRAKIPSNKLVPHYFEGDKPSERAAFKIVPQRSKVNGERWWGLGSRQTSGRWGACYMRC